MKSAQGVTNQADVDRALAELDEVTQGLDGALQRLMDGRMTPKEVNAAVRESRNRSKTITEKLRAG